jgi:hypothetical protein
MLTDDDDDDDVVYCNPSVYDFLLTLDTQLTFVFQFWTNSRIWSTFRRPVTVHGVFSELWSVPRSFQMRRTLQHS